MCRVGGGVRSEVFCIRASTPMGSKEAGSTAVFSTVVWGLGLGNQHFRGRCSAEEFDDVVEKMAWNESHGGFGLRLLRSCG